MRDTGRMRGEDRGLLAPEVGRGTDIPGEGDGATVGPDPQVPIEEVDIKEEMMMMETTGGGGGMIMGIEGTIVGKTGDTIEAGRQMKSIEREKGTPIGVVIHIEIEKWMSTV